MKRKRRARAASPYVTAPGELPLCEVVVQLAARTRQLNRLDDEINSKLATVEQALRVQCSSGRPVDVPFPTWGKLGWSGGHARYWRLVVVDDQVCEDLAAMSRRCRVASCFILGKLVERLGLVPVG